jgi:uncharacterized protein YjiS (DUF1127 family)
MKRDHYYRETANAGGGASNVPFYDFVAPNLYAGEAVATAFTAGYETVKCVVTAFNRWRWERTTRKALFELDSATLADIGIARSEIGAVARKAAENPTFTPTRRWRWTS